jgi:hypothetical protein
VSALDDYGHACLPVLVQVLQLKAHLTGSADTQIFFFGNLIGMPFGLGGLTDAELSALGFLQKVDEDDASDISLESTDLSSSKRRAV